MNEENIPTDAQKEMFRDTHLKFTVNIDFTQIPYPLTICKP